MFQLPVTAWLSHHGSLLLPPPPPHRLPPFVSTLLSSLFVKVSLLNLLNASTFCFSADVIIFDSLSLPSFGAACICPFGCAAAVAAATRRRQLGILLMQLFFAVTGAQGSLAVVMGTAPSLLVFSLVQVGHFAFAACSLAWCCVWSGFLA